jgi:hypothetical protein
VEVEPDALDANMLSLMRAHEKLDTLLELFFGDDEEEADDNG